VASGDAHTRDSIPVACYVSFETRGVRDLRTCRAGQGRYLPDDTVQFVSLTHISPRTAELENNNYRMIS